MMGTNILVVLAFFIVGQQSKSEPAPDSTAAAQTIDLRYARAQMQLAEANLQRVQRMNQRLARTVPASVVAEYQRDFEVAKAQMQQVESQGVEHGFAIWLRRAESIWKSADTIWKDAVKINQQAPGTLNTLDVERYRLRAEVTRLQLERGQSLVQGPHEAQLEWEVELLNNEVQRLKEESRAAPFSRFCKVWWW
jgi:hypothetical protein